MEPMKGGPCIPDGTMVVNTNIYLSYGNLDTAPCSLNNLLKTLTEIDMM
jgi:hypothetical protein